MALIDDFVAAYLRSRFFHGECRQDRATVMTTGLLVSNRATFPGSTAPATALPSNKGPIYLALFYEDAKAYGSMSRFRVFLGIDRAEYMRSYELANQNLSQEKFDNYNHFANTANFSYVYHDRDQAAAVMTGTDIPTDCIWDGKLSALCALGAHNRKVQTIMTNIASFNNTLPSSTAAMIALMQQAYQQHRIGDSKQQDVNKCTIPRQPIAVVNRPTTTSPSTGRTIRSGNCDCTIL